MISRLWRQFVRGSTAASSAAARLQFVLYTRSGCHLCEEAHERLEAARRQYGFALRVVDVDTDPALATRYGEEVPVVTVDDKVRFRGRVNPVLLERLLGAAKSP